MIRKILYIAFINITILKSASVYSKDIIVCPDCGIRTVKDAIAQSSDGDRIIIKKGIYKENNLIINKAIEIHGEEFPVIDLEYSYQGFIVQTDNVKISGLEIRNINVNYMNDLSAIKV